MSDKSPETRRPRGRIWFGFLAKNLVNWGVKMQLRTGLCPFELTLKQLLLLLLVFWRKHSASEIKRYFIRLASYCLWTSQSLPIMTPSVTYGSSLISVHLCAAQYNGSFYLSVTPKFYTEVLHQTLYPTAELWCKTLSQIKVDLVLHRTQPLEVYLHLPI